MEETTHLVFFVNGKRIVEKKPNPLDSVLSYLRDALRMTGCKVGCGEGGCGACTVMLSHYDKQNDVIRHHAANACLMPLCSVHGISITTVEGIGSTKTRLHPIQKRLAESYGSQCGFCTPGFVMSMYALLRNHPQPTEEQILNHLDGNLCRCTGYRPIVNGFKTFAKGNCALGDACCQNRTTSTNGKTNGEVKEDKSLPAYDPTQEPIFPPELKNNWEIYHNESLMFKGNQVTWFRPCNLQGLLELKTDYPNARLVIGNTEIGIETRFKGNEYPVQIQASHIPELKDITWSPTSVTFGASVTIADVIITLKSEVKDLPEAESRIFRGMLDVLQWFGSTQIRNVSSIGGNILTASPLSDLNPLLMAAGATLRVTRKGCGVREVKMDQSCFPSYRSTCLEAEDVLLSVSIPKSHKTEFYQGYKQSQRREDDIAIVNAGMRVVLEGDKVKDIALAYGGMASTTVLATGTMDALLGCSWNNDLVTKATKLLGEELHLEAGAPGGMVEYRQTLSVSLFFKFYLAVQMDLAKLTGSKKTNVPSSYRSAVADIDQQIPETCYVYDDVTSEQLADDAVGRPVPHDSAYQHTTGEALYLDDITPRRDELFMALVLSDRAHAELTGVDPGEALGVPGVVDFISSQDVPGSNRFGLQVDDEEVFATDKVLCQGQVIAAIVAETRHAARLGATKVKVNYNDLEPVLTIKDAIKKKSFYGEPLTLTHGDPDGALPQCDHVLEGEANSGAQEHFYLEPMASLVIPGVEDGRLEVHTTTHFVNFTQKAISKVLGVSAHKVVVRVKRLGGAFGGKQTRNLLTSLPAAVAANKLGRPVRCVLDRDVDMQITGTRHPAWTSFKVGFNNDGRIMVYCPEVHVNGGMSLDYSKAVIGKQIQQFENAYNIPNLRFVGNVVRTNVPSNTAFRGFGIPQIHLVTEQMIQLVAHTLDKSPEEIRRINMYQTGDITPHGQELSPCNVIRCWEECMSISDFSKRRREVNAFNSENRWKKRGLSMIPVKYGLSFPAVADVLNQASALVHIYVDGSVLITHGGAEMGQGINIKMIQIASRVLKVPVSSIHIDETSTDKIHNSSPTAASCSSDLQGLAVQNACETLYERLLPFKNENPEKTWTEWIQAAYFSRVQLMATGFAKPDALHYEDGSRSNVVYNYFVYGAGCTEVEVDCLTGHHHVIRTDLVIDAGRSLNPAVDIGQIEGCFVQAYGMFVLEDYKVSPKGSLLSKGPGTYKIPSVSNIPWKFNVHLLKNSDNKKAVYGSKGVGEPPMVLSLSAFFAIYDAIKSARADMGITQPFHLDSPATVEVIRMTCKDPFTERFPPAKEGTYKPWTVTLA